MINSKESIIIKNVIESKGYVTSKELANLLNVSSKTINRYIVTINSFLSQYDLSIISSRGLGYAITGKKENISKVLSIAKDYIDGVNKSDNLENRIASVISLLINNEYISVDSMSQNLNLSNTSISKLFIKVKDYIQKYELVIESKPCYGSFIKGSEKQIRLLIMDNLIKISENRFISTELDNIYNSEIKIVEKILLKYLSLNNLIMSDKDFDLLLIKFIISISRNKNRNSILIEKKNFDNYTLIKNIVDEVNQSLNIKLDECEISYILHYSNTIIDSYNDKQHDLDNKIFITIQEALREIYIICGNDYSKDDEFLSTIQKHIKRMIQRVLEDIRMTNPLKNQIRNNLVMEMNLAVFLSKKIEKEFNIKIDENELAYIAIHFAVSSEKMKQEKIKNVCIVCNYGMGTGQLLAQKIRQNTSDINVVGVYPLRYLESISLIGIDFIIATTPIKNSDNKIIYVEDIFSDDVLNNIKSKMYESEHKKDIFRNMFKKDVFFKVDVNTKEEVISLVTNNMKSKGYISEESINKIIEREKVSSTEIGNLVAIPHTIMNDNNSSIISVVILDKPIIWHKKQVQVVFIVFFSNKEKENAPVFRKLYNLFKDESYVKKVANSCNFDEFISMIV